MTVGDVLRAMLRQWYAVLAVAVIGGAAFVSFANDSGTYTTRTVVSFRFAETPAIAPDNGSEVESVIAFAGAVATQVNKGKPTPRYSSNNAPYYGAGVREGIVVGLRDEGNQWAPVFPSAMIEVQIVGRTREWVQAQQARVLDEIQLAVDAQQVTVTNYADRITANVEPLTTGIQYIAFTRTTFLAAVGAMTTAVLIVGGWLAVLIDRRRRRRLRYPRQRERPIVEAMT